MAKKEKFQNKVITWEVGNSMEVGVEVHHQELFCYTVYHKRPH